MRPSGRAPDQMRPITIETAFTKHAEGSVLVSFGDTRVLCSVAVLAVGFDEPAASCAILARPTLSMSLSWISKGMEVDIEASDGKIGKASVSNLELA